VDLRLLSIAALSLCAAARLTASGGPSQQELAELLGDPAPAQWRELSRFDLALTRRDFESRLDRVFDPGRGLRPYLRLGEDELAVFGAPGEAGAPAAVVRFAASRGEVRPPPVGFRTPERFRGLAAPPGAGPLSGLRVAIEPADIGGRWARLEDRSVEFAGFGLVNEGDLNLLVGRLLAERLSQLGASVFLVRDRAEPVLAVRPQDLGPLAEDVMINRPWLLPESFRRMTASLPAGSPRRLEVAEDMLLTKTLETRARAALVRGSFQPDITIVLQHNATPDSTEGRLNPVNRNIFFVNGAYSPEELGEPEQRFRLLTKLLEDTTPTETAVAAAIAARFRKVTGFAPVLYGNSASTRLVVPGDPYVVARNLAFNREHDGPVVVTEPYFMNQAQTLARLVAGDYAGERVVAGKYRVSIYREYAGCVADGLLDSYHGAQGAGAAGR
jgi:hypothetical protein